MLKNRRRTQIVRGRALEVGGKYLCWNSFKADWYLGPKRLSEIFAWPRSPRLERALMNMPLAHAVFIPATTSGGR